MKPLFSFTEWPKISVYDIEATEWVNVTMICHVDEFGNHESFPSVSKYLDWLFTEWPGDILWAHAGGHYDHRFLIAEAKDRGWDFRAAMSGGNIVVLTISNGERTIKFADSYRLMPDGLKKIGDTVGLPKLDVDRAHIELLPLAEQREYCFRDCEIVLKGLQLMRSILTAQNADFAFTLASIASRWVRRGDNIDWSHFVMFKNRQMIPHPNVALWDPFSYGGYYGGRCEMFKRGVFKGPLYYYDIVSSYPASMREDLPLYYKGFYAPPKNMRNVESFLDHPGLTECVISIPRAKVTPLCVKDRSGRLSFFHGTTPIPCTWTNIELLTALEHGAKIVSITGQARFEAKPFLRPFVDCFYALRQKAKDEKDPFRTYAFKILLNSLYGKLVETVQRKSYLTANEIPDAQERGAKIETTPTNGVFMACSEEEGPFRHAAAGAYVTAYSRLRLFRGLIDAQKRGDVYYCDTDSIVTDAPLEKTGSALGDWNHEATFTEMEIVLPKVYRAVTDKGKEIFKCKGCPIVREHEAPEMPRKRWEVFKHYADAPENEHQAILEKDGITGFTTDIREGRLMPKRRRLLRSLKSGDKKREWNGPDSWPKQMEGA